MNEVEQTIQEMGSCEISNGTMRVQDTLPKMLETLNIVNPEGYSQCMMPAAGFPLIPDHALEDANAEWWEASGHLVTEVIVDALNESAPDGFFFGSHPDDGACIGYWPLSN